jgi:alcohol dehydrogenase class IV
MIEFHHRALPWNVVFGAGKVAALPGGLRALGYSRALVMCTPHQSDSGQRIVELLGPLAVGLFDGAVMHVPAATVAAAWAAAEEVGADCTVGIGGGSTTGLGKALALRHGLPLIAIPTSYAGSEMTNIWGITDGDRKSTARDAAVLPKLTIYDPELTLSLPAKFAGASGLNAMAQAVANITVERPNPFVESMALHAVTALAQSLPQVIAEPHNIDARSQALLGACLAGAALGIGTTGLHHRICHTLGGTFNTPHAETHAILLPHSVAFNADAAAAGTAKLAQALGVEDAALGLFELAKSIDVPTALSEIGVRESDLDRAAEIATEKPVDNPEPVTTQKVRALLEDAFQGRAPVGVRVEL